VTGSHAAPPNDSSAYLTVGSGTGYPEEAGITFSVPLVYFGFYFGSPDSDNVILFNGGGEIARFNGNRSIPPRRRGPKRRGFRKLLCDRRHDVRRDRHDVKLTGF
jgi:hypothetical protein